MQRIFTLPEYVITTIFEYYDPYKTQYECILDDLRWNQFWYRCFSEWFVTNHTDYIYYMLHRNRNNGGSYLSI